MFGKKMQEALQELKKDLSCEIRSIHDVFSEEFREHTRETAELKRENAELKRENEELKRENAELKKDGSFSPEEGEQTYAKLIDEWKNGPEDSE